MRTRTARLRLPATSANLGPGFDALALALELFLEIEAVEAPRFSIQATGRNSDVCAGLKNNLLLNSYERVLESQHQPVTALQIRMRNDIPLGMGCGSSAAVRLAGVALAAHFGGLGWDSARIVEEAAHLEGHPDNVAACWYGGFTVAASDGALLRVASIPPPPGWRALLVLPGRPLATAKARSVLPDTYSAHDTVANVQRAALLTAAFALARADLLALATADRLHQPYRAALCPLLPALLPLAGKLGALSVTLSGAGPAVLLLLNGEGDPAPLHSAIRELSHPVAGPVHLVDARLWPREAKLDSGE